MQAYMEDKASTMMKPSPIDTTQSPPEEDMDTTNRKQKSETQEVATQDKKQFTRHSYRCTKKQLRIDFATANTKKQAQTLWYEVITILRNIDTTMLIHNPTTYDQTLTSKDELPTQQELANFTCIVESVQKRQHKMSYSSITTITTSRPVCEFKRLDPTFVQQLNDLGVYL